jgi:hypothetical protein
VEQIALNEVSAHRFGTLLLKPKMFPSINATVSAVRALYRTGVITDMRKATKGDPIKYLVLLDARFHREAIEVDAFGYELEPL